MIYRKFSKRQLLAMTWWNRPGLKAYDAIICDGAVRSGKTVSMADGFFLWSMSTFQGKVFGVCGKTIASLRRNIIINLPGWLGGILEFRENRMENKLTVRCPGGWENTYYLFGGQDESSYMQIQGITLAGVLLDEVALMPRSFVEQACARCSEPGSKMWFNCNPASAEHWFYKEWICKTKQKNALHLHFTMADNPGLDPKIRSRYEQLYTGLFYRRYVLGQWCASEGLVYSFEPEKHIAKQLPQSGRYYISVDYGTMNPFSAGLWCVTPERAVRLREYYYSGRETGKLRTDEEHYRALVELADGLPVERIVIDPSAASFIATVRSHGLFSVRKAKNDVLPGIRQVTALLRSGKLVFSRECTNTIREFALYCWQEDPAVDAPVKENDHAMDDIRYFCASVLTRQFPEDGLLAGGEL